MMNYHADIVWEIDRYLLVLSVLLAAMVVLYVAFKEWVDSRTVRKLAILRRDFQKAALSGDASSKTLSETLGRATPREFLEMIRSEMWILPEEFTRELKEYLRVSGKFSEVEKIARTSKNKWQRIQALVSLGYSEDPAALEIIRTSLDDPDEDIAYFSMLALGQIKSGGAARVLLDFIGDHVSRGNRVISLLEKFPASVADDIMPATRHKSLAVRFWSVKLLARWKPLHLLERIEALAQDEAPEVRAAVCECLGIMRDRKSQKILIQCLKDPIWFVRRRAVKALSSIFGPEGIPEIIGLLRDENWLVRDGVKKAMTHDIHTALPFIEKLIHEDERVLKKDCVEILEDSAYLTILFKNLLSQDAQVRQRAILLLKDIISSGAHLGLESALAGFERESRASILKEIEKIDGNLAEHIQKKIEHLLVEV